MEKRQLGQTGLSVSPLGLGTVKFGRNEGIKYPQNFDIPDEDSLADLLALAKDLGINTLDTAPAYGMSEERLGRLLKDQREHWVIVGKVGEEFENGVSSHNFTPAHFKMSVERSLERLQADYIDVLLIHSDGNDMDILGNDALLQTMEEFKSQGLVRAIGASTKTVEGGLFTAEHMDVVMASFNASYKDELPVLERAAELNKGLLIKKGFASGHFSTESGDSPVDNSVEHAMRSIFSQRGVSSLIVGTINPKHLKENVSALEKFLSQN